MEFFKSYCREFNDEDENQLKHTEIYQSYMKILDEMIDAKLVQSFDDLQTEGFYKSFKDNQAAYKEINNEVYETLFGFVSFDAFKKEMLEIKKSNTTAETVMLNLLMDLTSIVLMSSMLLLLKMLTIKAQAGRRLPMQRENRKTSQ